MGTIRLKMRLFNFSFKKRPANKPAPADTQPKGGVETLKAGKLAKLALERVSRLIGAYGPRPAGSEADAACAKDLHEELGKFCDSTHMQEFTMHPGAFTGWIRMAVVLYPLSLLLMWFGIPFLSVILYILFGIVVYREYIAYKPMTDSLYPSVPGCNVHGVINPSGEVLHTVVFSGHHDSARLFRYNKLDKSTYAMKVGLPVALVGMLGIFSLVQLLVQAVTGRLFTIGLPPVAIMVFLILFTLMVPFVLPLWRFMGDGASPGAGDDLIGSSMAVELARFFSWSRRNGKGLEHTQLVFASFDGEEVGLRGSRAWCAQEHDMLQATAGDSWMFNFDCPYYSDELTFLVRDINGTVKLSQRMASGCVEIAQAMGYHAKSHPIPFLGGGTDAAEGARAGLHAVTLSAIAWDDISRPSVYHTPDDLPQAIEPKVVEQSLSIAIRFAQLLDGGDLSLDGPWNITAQPEELQPVEPEETAQPDAEGPSLRFRRLSKR